MTINPVTVPITTTTVETVVTPCTLLWMDKLTVDATARNPNVVPALIQSAPYAVDGSNNPHFAPATEYDTANIYMAAVAIPSIATALGAVQQGVIDWTNYVNAASAVLATAQQNQGVAQTAVTSLNAQIANATDPASVPALQSSLATAQNTLDIANREVARLTTLLDPASLGAAQYAVGVAQAAVTAAGVKVTSAQTAALASAQAAMTALTTPAS